MVGVGVNKGCGAAMWDERVLQIPVHVQGDVVEA